MSYQPLPTQSEDDSLDSNQKGIYSLAVRRDADSAPVSDGKLMGLLVDDEGRLKTSNRTSGYSIITGPVNTVNAVLLVDVRKSSNVVFHVKNTGTTAMAAGQFSFEASLDSTDGSNGTWFSIQTVRSNANTIETATGTLSLAVGAGLVYSWEASVNAYQYARVRCTTAVTTNSIATWIAQRGAYATEPIPAAQASATQSVTGSVSVSASTPSAGAAYALVTAASTNAVAVKASAGSLFEVTLSNITATAGYVKLYNKAVAPTVGTDVPVVTFAVAANTTVVYEFGAVGKRFTTGIALAVTAGSAASDTAAFVAGMQISATYI